MFFSRRKVICKEVSGRNSHELAAVQVFLFVGARGRRGAHRVGQVAHVRIPERSLEVLKNYSIIRYEFLNDLVELKGAAVQWN